MQMQPCVLLKYGELVLKGGNRRWFEQRLLSNIKDALSAWPPTDRPLIRRRGTVLVLCTRAELQADLVKLARNVVGVSVVQPVWRVPKSAAAAEAAAVRLLRELRTPAVSPAFAVRSRRRDKQFGLTSEQLAARIGAHVRAELGWQVDLTSPDVELAIEVDRHEIFLGTQRYPGQGGLPVGSSGRALVLLSGGFDSPVAAYRAMRRGLACDYLHCTGAPYTDASSTYKAYALARQLGQFQPRSRLYVVAVGRAQRALAASGAGEAQIVAQRRLYLRLASALAKRLAAQAVVTGDSLGQVASQTLPNLTTIEAAASLPVLRPLLAFDKQEILAEATRIGTAPIAALPDQDCCQLFMPRRVATHTFVDQLLTVEARAGIDVLVQDLLEGVQRFDLQPGRFITDRPDVEDAASPSVGHPA